MISNTRSTALGVNQTELKTKGKCKRPKESATDRDGIELILAHQQINRGAQSTRHSRFTPSREQNQNQNRTMTSALVAHITAL